MTTEGVRRLLVAADAHAAAAAAAGAAGPSSSTNGSGSDGSRNGSSSSMKREPFRLDVGSCRGLERGVRQAAALGMPQLRAALGLPTAP